MRTIRTIQTGPQPSQVFKLHPLTALPLLVVSAAFFPAAIVCLSLLALVRWLLRRRTLATPEGRAQSLRQEYLRFQDLEAQYVAALLLHKLKDTPHNRWKLKKWMATQRR